MIYGSLFSGIEAATVAWDPLGWTPAFFAECGKFPSRVLGHHYPKIINYGDVTNFKEWPDHAIDILVGGSPCQSFSIAGLRKGIDDPRGNLTLSYIAIAARYRPRWLVWENVPGVLSSNGGKDFYSFLRGLEECGYHASWRVLDAQFVRVDGFAGAVPQRRRRLFVVGYTGDWRRAAAVLFERESMSGDPAPCRKKKKSVAALTATGVGVCGADDNQAQAGHLIASSGSISYCLNAGGMGRRDYETETFIHQPGNKLIRRLTPIECERLQGFPDNWTAIPNAADAPRYKALGNSMAVNVMRWIGRRIEMVERIYETAATEQKRISCALANTPAS